MEPCSALGPGASGGPWLSSSGVVGAVNQAVLGDQVTGTYLGNEAKEAFDEAQRPTSAAAVYLSSQNARVSGGTAMVPVSCPASSSCRGTAVLTSQGSTAVIAKAKHTRQPVMLIGRSNFAIRPGHSSTVRIRISMRTQRLLKRGHSVLLATLTLRVIHAGVTTIRVTLRR
jgi:hypothetical protein